MSNVQTFDADRALSRIRAFENVDGALLPILHALQEEFGYVDEATVPMIADALNIPKAEVHGVISFHHDFRRHPPGRHELRLCRAEACQSMGCDKTISHVEQRLGVKLGETTADGTFTLRDVFCLGLCAQSPAAMLDGQPHGSVTPQVADMLIDSALRRTARAGDRSSEAS
jgi:formate dehydrogenase subunit gamma